MADAAAGQPLIKSKAIKNAASFRFGESAGKARARGATSDRKAAGHFMEGDADRPRRVVATATG
jgi:hypothetical protein